MGLRGDWPDSPGLGRLKLRAERRAGEFLKEMADELSARSKGTRGLEDLVMSHIGVSKIGWHGFEGTKGDV